MQSEQSNEALDHTGSAGPIVIPLAVQRPEGEEGTSMETESVTDAVAEDTGVAAESALVQRFDLDPIALDAAAEQCMIASIASHPSNGLSEADPLSVDDADGEFVGLMLVTPTDAPAGMVTLHGDTADSADSADTADTAERKGVTGDADAVAQSYAILGQSAIEEVRALENSTRIAQAEADPAILRRRALDNLIRSEEEAHQIIEAAQRDAASRTTRAELKAKLTLDQARERADLLIASAQARSELLVEEACKSAVFDIEEETRELCDSIVDEAKIDAKSRVSIAAEEARHIVDRARRQGTEIVAAAELDGEERREAAAEMFAAIESLERKVEEDARMAADASAHAAAAVLDQAERDADAMRQTLEAFEADTRSQAEVIVRNAHTRSEQIISGADETAAWFAERIHARETAVREATEAHMGDLLERAEATSLELLLNARERSNEMIAEAQRTVDRMLHEGRRVAQDLVGGARSEIASDTSFDATLIDEATRVPGADSIENAGFAGMWNESVDDEALDDFFDGIAERGADEVFSQ